MHTIAIVRMHNLTRESLILTEKIAGVKSGTYGGFRSVVVITLASHARGRGFDPRRNLGFSYIHGSFCRVSYVSHMDAWFALLTSQKELL